MAILQAVIFFFQSVDFRKRGAGEVSVRFLTSGGDSPGAIPSQSRRLFTPVTVTFFGEQPICFVPGHVFPFRFYLGACFRPIPGKETLPDVIWCFRRAPASTIFNQGQATPPFVFFLVDLVGLYVFSVTRPSPPPLPFGILCGRCGQCIACWSSLFFPPLPPAPPLFLMKGRLAVAISHTPCDTLLFRDRMFLFWKSKNIVPGRCSTFLLPFPPNPFSLDPQICWRRVTSIGRPFFFSLFGDSSPPPTKCTRTEGADPGFYFVCLSSHLLQEAH